MPTVVGPTFLISLCGREGGLGVSSVFLGMFPVGSTLILHSVLGHLRSSDEKKVEERIIKISLEYNATMA